MSLLHITSCLNRSPHTFSLLKASSPKRNNSASMDTSKCNKSKSRNNSSNVFNIPTKRNLRIMTLNCRSIQSSLQKDLVGRRCPASIYWRQALFDGFHRRPALFGGFHRRYRFAVIPLCLNKSLFAKWNENVKQIFFLQCSPIVASRNFSSKMLF